MGCGIRVDVNIREVGAGRDAAITEAGRDFESAYRTAI
jgi:hypothetical protein